MAVADFAVHGSLGSMLDPSVSYFSDVLGEHAVPEHRSEFGNIDAIVGRRRSLGTGIGSTSVAGWADYRGFLAYAFDAVDWNPDEFYWFRVSVQHPPIPSKVYFDFPLEEQ